MKKFAKPYAEVLLESASQAGVAEQIAKELRDFADLVTSSPQLSRMGENAAIAPADKEKMIVSLATKMNLGELSARMIQLLVRNRRLSQVGDVADAFRELLDRKEALAHAEVRSATELTAEEKARVELALTKATGRKIRMTLSIDPSLVAGVVAQVGSTVYDASLRGEIQRIRRTLGAATTAGAPSGHA